MKDGTIDDAHRVMRRATRVEGLGVEDAIAKYHDDLDLISRQYALLPSNTRPACLAAMPHHLGGRHYTLLPLVVDQFVTVFGQLAGRCQISEVPSDLDELTADREASAEDQVFYVPDMNCKHCIRTITGVLESMGIKVVDIDLISKRVVAEFRSPRNRVRAFEAIRDGGYNPSAQQPVASATETPEHSETAV
jgi:copper chaperone CopZ